MPTGSVPRGSSPALRVPARHGARRPRTQAAVLPPGEHSPQREAPLQTNAARDRWTVRVAILLHGYPQRASDWDADTRSAAARGRANQRTDQCGLPRRSVATRASHRRTGSVASVTANPPRDSPLRLPGTTSMRSSRSSQPIGTAALGRALLEGEHGQVRPQVRVTMMTGEAVSFTWSKFDPRLVQSDDAIGDHVGLTIDAGRPGEDVGPEVGLDNARYPGASTSWALDDPAQRWHCALGRSRRSSDGASGLCLPKDAS